jgi:hypothetical protein
MFAMLFVKHSALLLDTLISLLLDFSVSLESGFTDEEESAPVTSLELGNGLSEGPTGLWDSLEPGSGEGPLELSSHATSVSPKASAAEAAESFLKFICFPPFKFQ